MPISGARNDAVTIVVMSTLPVQFLLLTLAGWMTRDHQRVTAYLLAENAVLREHLRGQRLLFSNAQRRRLASAASKLGRKALAKLDTLVTPDTLFRWYRRLVACKYDGTARRSRSQPARTTDIVQLVRRMANDNPSWGYTRIRGALRNIGHATPSSAFCTKRGLLPRPSGASVCRGAPFFVRIGAPSPPWTSSSSSIVTLCIHAPSVRCSAPVV